jgi:hypothetical protein
MLILPPAVITSPFTCPSTVHLPIYKYLPGKRVNVSVDGSRDLGELPKGEVIAADGSARRENRLAAKGPLTVLR